MEEALNKVKSFFDTKKLVKINDVVLLIMAIFSVLLGFFWYLGLPLAIISLIKKKKKIKEFGNTMPKVAAVFSIVGILHCVMLYISVFLMFYSELVVFY